MPDHHEKGQPAASTHVREKGGVTFYTNCKSPCRWKIKITLKISIDPNCNLYIEDLDYVDYDLWDHHKIDLDQNLDLCKFPLIDQDLDLDCDI